MAEESRMQAGQSLLGADRLREEQEKVVKEYDGRIQHWTKVAGDYEALDERLKTLPDQLSYDIMVPFGPLAFMPGKLVHTNEVTVLLGDNWFAKCSAKQAQKMVNHRMAYVKSELDGLLKTRKNLEARVEFTKDLRKTSGKEGDYVDIREEVGSGEAVVTKGKHRVAHKPNSKPKLDAALDLRDEGEEDGGGGGEGGGGGVGGGVGGLGGVLSEEELWARLDELEKQEEQDDEQDRMSDNADTNGEDTTSSSSEEEKEGEGDGEGGDPAGGPRENPAWTPVPHNGRVNGTAQPGGDGREEEDDEGAVEEEEEEEEEEANCLPTIYFCHTVEPKKVRINTGKNTTLKFSERKEQKEHSKRKKKNGHTNGHSHHELKITTPTDIYRLFVDVKNGEPVPRKSILKSRSRENSVCSDTSESSAADLEERRMFARSFSHDDTTHSDTSDGITEEDSPTTLPLHPANRFQAFSGTVVEKDPMPSGVPHLTISPPALPTIPERKQEEVAPAEVVAPSQEPQEPQDPPKRVSKFKAARLQQK